MKTSSKVLKDVPRGTYEKLEKFVALLLKWNKKINLTSRSSEKFIWPDHVLDSLEAVSCIKEADCVLMDVGAGAGFPGLVLSIATGYKTILVERNQKKCSFLREAKIETEANVIIENESVENLNGYKPDVILSRGVSRIREFLKLIEHLLSQDTQVITWKGKDYKEEVKEAENMPWLFDVNFKNLQRGTLVLLSNFRRV